MAATASDAIPPPVAMRLALPAIAMISASFTWTRNSHAALFSLGMLAVDDLFTLSWSDISFLSLLAGAASVLAVVFLTVFCLAPSSSSTAATGIFKSSAVDNSLNDIWTIAVVAIAMVLAFVAHCASDSPVSSLHDSVCYAFAGTMLLRSFNASRQVACAIFGVVCCLLPLIFPYQSYSFPLDLKSKEFTIGVLLVLALFLLRRIRASAEHVPTSRCIDICLGSLIALTGFALDKIVRISIREVFQNEHGHSDVLRALFFSTVAGLATGVGALLVVFDADWARRMNSFLLGVASGVMLVLSVFDLILPTLLAAESSFLCAFAFMRFDVTDKGFGLIGLGAALIFCLDLLLKNCDLDKSLQQMAAMVNEDSVYSLPKCFPHSFSCNRHHTLGKTELAQGDDNRLRFDQRIRSALLTALALAAHNAPEGLAVGITSISKDQSRVWLMVFAMTLHNIPEGLAVAITMMNATHHEKLSVAIATLTGLVEPLSAILSVAFLKNLVTKTGIENALLAVGGVMITVTFWDLLPQALRENRTQALQGVTAGGVVMYLALKIMED